MVALGCTNILNEPFVEANMVHIVDCLERLLQLLERTGDHKLFKAFKVSVLSHSHALECVVVEHRNVLQRWTCWKFEVMW